MPCAATAPAPMPEPTATPPTTAVLAPRWAERSMPCSQVRDSRLMAHTTPAAVARRKNGDQGANPPVVKAGDLIGIAGNSGDAGNPHLHFHVQVGPRNAGEGFPVIFRDLRVSTNTQSPDTGWLAVVKRSLPTGPVYVLPQPPDDKKLSTADTEQGGKPLKRPSRPAGQRP